MRIKVWGCRGSIPSPGGDTSGYGGNTTCVEVRLEEGSLIIIDAGSGIRGLGQLLAREKKPPGFHLLLTHAHWDHLQGFPFFLPAYMEAFSIEVWSGPLAQAALRRFLEHQMDPPYFPVEFTRLPARFRFPAKEMLASELRIGSARITPMPLSHPNGGYGFRFSENGKSFVFLTDNEPLFAHPGGLAAAAYADLCRNADLLFHDAQYTLEEYRITRGWGHSTFQAAVDLSLSSGARRFGIFHHDPQHTDAQIDGFVQGCREEIARRGGKLECFGAREGMEIIV